MGRPNTIEEHMATVLWAKNVHLTSQPLEEMVRASSIAARFDQDLKKYFALAALARHKSADRALVSEASSVLFRTRVQLESVISSSICARIQARPEQLSQLLSAKIFGASKKQGISFRMPLTSCVPTRLCATACYSHDVLDAAPLTVVRGCINGVVAALYDCGDEPFRRQIRRLLKRHVQVGIKLAKDAVAQSEGWTREPYIRFAHVGEMPAFPVFANVMARMVRDLSRGKVHCVIYTRHPRARELDPGLWVINFTLDEASGNRAAWAPPAARMVYSAFGGRVSATAEVNFLEHHRWHHAEPVGPGRVCPATHPKTRSEDRTCDAMRCNLCMTPKVVRISVNGKPPRHA